MNISFCGFHGNEITPKFIDFANALFLCLYELLTNKKTGNIKKPETHASTKNKTKINILRCDTSTWSGV